MTEVVVIGGGVQGCSIAYHLARSGARVTLLEKHTLAAAASGASAGGVRHQGRDPREFPLAFRAIDRWRTLEDELAADLSYRRDGHLTTIEGEADLSTLTASIATQAATGLDIRLVQGDELRSIVPGIAPSVIAGAYSPNDGHANPTRTTEAFGAAAVRHGATIRTGVTVRHIHTRAGRVVGIDTSDGVLAADVVILAAGAWSMSLAADLGIDLPLKADGFQAMTTEPAPPALKPVMGSVRRMISLKQLPDGRYLLGGGWPGTFSLDRPRGETLAESHTGNIAAAAGIFPASAAVPIENAWLGIEAVAIDEVPIIGPVAGIDGLIVAAGFSGHGFAISPAVGEAVASLVASNEIPTEIAELTHARFDAAPALPHPTQRAG